ncbi:uncharacterized protein [Cardiocondyla obscurior]|uniref:uncharacterized protein n=1 Tax=Cardiocondyla obscurior TaxID=286306 RepID=UPI0039657016
MIRKVDQYFRLNRVLLLTVGLWPYQQSSVTKLQYILICAILVAFIIFQMTTFVTLSCTSDLLIKILSSTFFFAMFIIKYILFRFNIEGVKDLLMQLQGVYNKIQDKNEIAIINRYDYIAKCYTVVLTLILLSFFLNFNYLITFFTCLVFGVCTIPLGILFQYSMNVTNINSPINGSRKYYFMFTMEYFIDQEKYYYLYILHINAALCIGMIIMIATGTMFITYIQHTCGMFKIASYRIERAINRNINKTFTLERKTLMTEGTICAVDIHRQAIKLNKNLMSVLETMFFCLIMCCVAALSLNLFQIASSEIEIKNLLIPFMCVSVCLTHMFLSNVMGQIVTDHNGHVFTIAYNVQWYKSPLNVQRMILFLLQRNAKDFSLNVGGVFDASLDGFATVMYYI